MDKVPVHVAKGMSPEDAKAYRLADNRTADIATWDLALLPAELAELKGAGIDLSLLGFDDDELARLLDTGVTERFFSVRDPDVFTRLTQADYDTYDVITDDDLVEIAGDVRVVIDSDDHGWKFTLPPNQMVITNSATFDNRVFFVGFSPEANLADPCAPSNGRNFLYEVDIVNGAPVVNNLDTLRAEDADDARSTELPQGGIAPAPAFLFPSSNDPDCEGPACSPPPIACVGVVCFEQPPVNNPVRTLWTQDGIE